MPRLHGRLLREVWHDPVWSKVIATVICASAMTAVTYLFNGWVAIGRVVRCVWQYLLSGSTVPTWIILVLVLLALPTILALLVRKWPFAGHHQEAEDFRTDWRSHYRMDVFVGMRWRWGYDNNDDICDLASFCPVCDYEVFPVNISPFAVVDHIAFKCEPCDRDLGDFAEQYGSLENRVARLIQQKIRNGTWKSVAEGSGTQQPAGGAGSSRMGMRW